MNFYDLQYTTPTGDVVSMSTLKGKTVLIVNTATQCGLTPQFKGLEQLHQDHKDKGLVILGFPCNQFSNQEPETNDSMESVCLVNHGVTFQLTKKINVNGNQTDPVFKYLKGELGGLLGSRIKWNFTKFLIGPDGIPVKRYAPTTVPSKIEKNIKKLLNT